MSSQEHGYLLHKYIWGLSGQDTATTNENRAWCGTTLFNGDEENRMNLVPITSTFSFMSVHVDVNNNTADGATCRFLTSPDSMTTQVFGNQIVTVDQASGSFVDITNQDTVIAISGAIIATGMAAVTMRYTQ